MTYAEVIVDISAGELDRTFTYAVPDELAGSILPGTPVMVPFGRSDKPVRAYVTALSDTYDGRYRIKSILSAAEKRVSIEDGIMELAVWMKERYGCTMNRALQTVLPVKKKVRAKKDGTYRDPFAESRPAAYVLHEPNEDQRKAIDVFTSDWDRGVRKTYLLQGVTGSGKTDTYIHMIRHVIGDGRKVILLIPEIALTYQTIARLYSAFGDRIAVIHSRLSDGERYDQFRRCIDGDADIIIGPRSAIFAPFRNIGLIVIDEEHDQAYKNENVPRYSAIDIARKRAQMDGGSVVLASATPSPESYDSAMNGRYTLLRLDHRTGTAVLPAISIVDMREELKNGNRSIFSNELDGLIRDRLARKEQVILFMNRRGYSGFVSCRSCGEAIRCPHCDVSLTVHRGRILKCHYCGYSAPVPDRCPACGSPYIAEFGTGTQKLETMAAKMYPQARIARLDTDSVSGRHTSEQILEDMRNGNIDILIGTQMVVKGHDYPNVTLVGIMAADTSLYVSNYNAAQRTYELITQASGRAGRGQRPGNVVIQTYRPDHYAVTSAAEGSYEDYFRNEYAYRKLMRYPPYVHIWTVQISSRDEALLTGSSERFIRILDEICAGYGAESIGPAEPSPYKVNDFYRKMIYVKHADRDMLLKIKDEAEERFNAEETDRLEPDAKSHNSDISFLYDFT